MEQQETSKENEKKGNSRLRRARVRRLWGVKQAAWHTGVSITTYIRWEQGEQRPHLANLQALCNAFSMTPEELGYADMVPEGEIEPDPLRKAPY